MAWNWRSAKPRVGALRHSQVGHSWQRVYHRWRDRLTCFFRAPRPEAHILLFRRPLGTDPLTGKVPVVQHVPAAAAAAAAPAAPVMAAGGAGAGGAGALGTRSSKRQKTMLPAACCKCNKPSDQVKFPDFDPTCEACKQNFGCVDCSKQCGSVCGLCKKYRCNQHGEGVHGTCGACSETYCLSCAHFSAPAGGGGVLCIACQRGTTRPGAATSCMECRSVSLCARLCRGCDSRYCDCCIGKLQSTRVCEQCRMAFCCEECKGITKCGSCGTAHCDDCTCACAQRIE